MNRRQKNIINNFLTIIIATIIAVLGIIEMRNRVNHTEAMQAMQQLSQQITHYRKTHGSVPPRSYLDSILEKVQSYVRLGEVEYRALWIEFDSADDEILAYVEKEYTSLFYRDGFIVLRLNGRVEWMTPKEFKQLLAQQQSPMELQMQHE